MAQNLWSTGQKSPEKDSSGTQEETAVTNGVDDDPEIRIDGVDDRGYRSTSQFLRKTYVNLV